MHAISSARVTADDASIVLLPRWPITYLDNERGMKISGLTASTAYYFEMYEPREDFWLAK